MIFKFKD